MTAKTDLPPNLQRARSRANTLTLEAEEAEKEARRARRRATGAQRRYSDLLLKHQGQDALPLRFDT